MRGDADHRRRGAQFDRATPAEAGCRTQSSGQWARLSQLKCFVAASDVNWLLRFWSLKMYADRFDNRSDNLQIFGHFSVSLFTNLFSQHANSKCTIDSSHFMLEKKIKRNRTGYHLKNEAQMTVKHPQARKVNGLRPGEPFRAMAILFLLCKGGVIWVYFRLLVSMKNSNRKLL